MKKYILFSIIVFSALWVFSPSVVSAANHYIRTGATGSGSDWINAYGSLPSTLVRGNTYYLADGDYGYFMPDTAVSGSSIITIKKAISSDHGTDVGWNSSYGDGQAIFSGIQFKTSYITIDGQTGSGTSGYGIKIVNPGDTTLVYSHQTYATTNITVRHCEITNDNMLNATTGEAFEILSISNWTIENNYIHAVACPLLMAGVTTLSFQYNYVGAHVGDHGGHGGTGHCETIRDTWTSSHVTIANNYFEDGEGSGWFATTGISEELGDPETDFKIYNNVINFTGNSYTYSDGYRRPNGYAHILALNYGTQTDFHFNHNTIVNIDLGLSARVYLGEGNDSSVINLKNNLWYCDPAKSCKPADHNFRGSAGIVDSNWYSSSISHYTGTNDQNGGSANPFISLTGKNFRLAQSTNSGVALGSPYNIDPDGNTRGADGTWDRGAYEYGGTGPVCTSHNYFSCYSGDVYWYDSCGNREDLKEECGSNTCSGGACQTPTQICGNSIREGTEACDGTDLAGQSCISQGFTGGTLTCNSQCVGFVTTACTPKTGNLLTNGDFESGFTNGIANSWNLVTDGSAAYSLLQDTGYQGSSQKITISSSGIWGLFFYQTPAFQLNQFYNWSFWYKTPGTGGLTAEITNASDTQVVYSASLALTNGAWAYKTITFQYTNSLANELRFYSNSPGSYWIDNISLTPVSADTTPPAAPSGIIIS